MRKDERVTINQEFESFDATVSEYVSNISRSGVFVKARTPLRVGTKVKLRFTVLLDDVEIIEGIGRVVRAVEDPPGMGLEFVELTPASRDVIDRLFPAAGAAAGDDDSSLSLGPDGKVSRGPTPEGAGGGAR
ncbi:MAG: PilZ domain-containing protein [Deltaproteobacteria bacterium]|nr:PilZ domain-containing protein [Deltaproteobacteria bacterium]